MKIVLSLAAAAMVVAYGVGAMAAERPTFEVQSVVSRILLEKFVGFVG